MKGKLRKELLAIRKRVPEANRKEWSKEICRRISCTLPYQRSATVLLYWPYASEVDVTALFEAARREKKRLYLPRILPDFEMEAAEFPDGCEMKENSFGILEPKDTDIIPEDQLDVVVVPGVGFHANRHRIGYGAGYYDRFLRRTKAFQIGAAFECQITRTIFHEPHDWPLDLIVTEKGEY